MDEWRIALAATGLAVGLGVMLWRIRSRRVRGEELRQWGLRHGWTVGATADPGDRFRTPLFQGRRRRGRCHNVMTRQDAHAEQLLFDYEFLENAGKHTHRVRQTVLNTSNTDRALPPFQLRPESLLDKVASAFGHGDIDFEHRPEFSRRYHLRGEDEPAIRKLFDSTRMRFFEQNPGWSVESDGEWLVTYRARKAPGVEELDAFVRDCQRIREVLRPPRG